MSEIISCAVRSERLEGRGLFRALIRSRDSLLVFNNSKQEVFLILNHTFKTMSIS